MEAIEGFRTLLNTFPHDMTIVRELSKVYKNQRRDGEAVSLYDETRSHYMQQTQSLKPDGDIDCPFNWYPRLASDLTVGMS